MQNPHRGVKIENFACLWSLLKEETGKNLLWLNCVRSKWLRNLRSPGLEPERHTDHRLAGPGLSAPSTGRTNVKRNYQYKSLEKLWQQLRSLPLVMTTIKITTLSCAGDELKNSNLAPLIWLLRSYLNSQIN